MRRSGQLRNLLAVGAGNAIEAYDWSAYTTFSPFFAASFFTSGDPSSDLLATLAVFAIGFVARPFGGFFFGWLADRIGRQPAMTLSVGVAAAGSLIIGITPTASSIHLAAPAILLVARLVQGLAHGGELPAAQTYLAEVAPRGRRGLWSSVIYISAGIGTLGGTLLGALSTVLLTHAQLMSFGWRIPFLFGGVLGLFALVMRTRMEETEIFTQGRATGGRAGSVWRQVISRPVLLLRVVGITVGGTIAFYTWAVSASEFAIGQRGTDPGGALWASSAATVIFLLVLPLWGALSDRIGRRPVLLIGWISLAVLFFPLEALIQGQAWQLLISMSVALILVGATVSIMPALFAEMFPTGIRAAGLAVPYSLAVALFGGTAPYLQGYFNERHATSAFNWWAILLIAISVVTVFLSSETKGSDLAARRPADDDSADSTVVSTSH